MFQTEMKTWVFNPYSYLIEQQPVYADFGFSATHMLVFRFRPTGMEIAIQAIARCDVRVFRFPEPALITNAITYNELSSDYAEQYLLDLIHQQLFKSTEFRQVFKEFWPEYVAYQDEESDYQQRTGLLSA